MNHGLNHTLLVIIDSNNLLNLSEVDCMKKNPVQKKFLLFGLILCTLLFAFALMVPAASSTTGNTDSTRGVSLSLVNQNPDPALSGNTVDVKIAIANTGGLSIQSLNVAFIPSYPFAVVSGVDTVQTIDALQGYQGSQDSGDVAILKYTVAINKDAPAGTYDLQFKYWTTDGSIVEVTQSVSISITGSNNVEIIHIDKSILVPGNQSTVIFTINNVGASPLRNLKFSWDNTEHVVLPVGSDNTRYIKYLDVGDHADVSYDVIADTSATAGLYLLNLHLSYDDVLTGATKNITTSAGVYVGGGTDFDVAFTGNTGGQLSLTVANVGSNPARAVAITLPAQPGWTVTGPSSTIIGNLNNGDYTVAAFTAQQVDANSSMNRSTNRSAASITPPQTDNQSRNSSGVVNRNALHVQVTYTNTLGERITLDKFVPVASIGTAGTGISGANSAGTRTTTTTKSYATYYIVALILIVLVLGFLLYRNHKRLKQSGMFDKKKK